MWFQEGNGTPHFASQTIGLLKTKLMLFKETMMLVGRQIYVIWQGWTIFILSDEKSGIKKIDNQFLS